MNILNVNALGAATAAPATGRAQPAGKTGAVEATFNQALDALTGAQNQSDTLIQKLAAGENVDLHQVMIAAEQTDVSFRVALAIRDKLVEAYQEIMRMAV